MSAAAAVPRTGPNGSRRSTSRSNSTTSSAPKIKPMVAGYYLWWNDLRSATFLPCLYLTPELNLDSCRPKVERVADPRLCNCTIRGCVAQRSGGDFTTFTLPVTPALHVSWIRDHR